MSGRLGLAILLSVYSIDRVSADQHSSYGAAEAGAPIDSDSWLGQLAGESLQEESYAAHATNYSESVDMLIDFTVNLACSGLCYSYHYNSSTNGMRRAGNQLRDA